jgi:hypothetical protein
LGLVVLAVAVVTVLAAQVTVTVAGATPVVAHYASADEVGIAIAAATPTGNSQDRASRGIRRCRQGRINSPA